MCTENVKIACLRLMHHQGLDNNMMLRLMHVINYLKIGRIQLKLEIRTLKDNISTYNFALLKHYLAAGHDKQTTIVELHCNSPQQSISLCNHNPQQLHWSQLASYGLCNLLRHLLVQAVQACCETFCSAYWIAC